VIVLGIDPGPEFSGVVVYDCEGKAVMVADKSADVAAVLGAVSKWAPGEDVVVAIERMQSYGIAGGSLLDTARTAGRLEQRALDCGATVVLLYRREVLKALDVTGKGNRDSLVRQRMIEIHGGTTEAAVGKKANQGPLYGVSGHAWQALAVAVAAAETLGSDGA
jgi:hypothetical protein